MKLSSFILNHFVPDLVARDEGRGLEAVEALKKEGLTPKFHQLDILSDESVKKIGAFIVDNYGGLDVLVNNAGITYKVGCLWSVFVCTVEHICVHFETYLCVLWNIFLRTLECI